MYYVVCKSCLIGEQYTYSIVEPVSKICMEICEKDVIKLLKRTKIAKLYLENGEIKEKKWPLEINKTTNGAIDCSKYICTGLYYNKYRLFDCSGMCSFIRPIAAYDYIIHEKISNGYTDLDSKCHFVDCCNETIDIEYTQEIITLYKRFVAKTKLMGFDMTFTFETYGHEVVLAEYTGSSKDVVIPDFVTIIQSGAFLDKDITSVQLNTGLKLIGHTAFYNTLLHNVTVPSTVEIIGHRAFERLHNSNNASNSVEVKLENDKTIMLR